MCPFSSFENPELTFEKADNMIPELHDTKTLVFSDIWTSAHF